jgi:hypothetical protein
MMGLQVNTDVATVNPFQQKFPHKQHAAKVIFPKKSVHSTTLQNNEYIDELNKSLRCELNALHTYSSLQASASQTFNHLTSNHLKAVDVLSHLIIKNRGIPEKSSTISGHISKIMLQLTAALPHAIHKSAAESTLSHLENGLKNRYENLYNLSPIVDHPALIELKNCANSNLKAYRLLLLE